MEFTPYDFDDPNCVRVNARSQNHNPVFPGQFKKKKKTITWIITIASYGKRNVSSALVLILACSKAQELFEGNRREKETTFQKWQLRQLLQNFLQIFTPKMKPVCIEMPIFISNSFTCTWLHFFLDNQKLCDEIIIEKCWWQPRVCSDHGYDIQS